MTPLDEQPVDPYSIYFSQRPMKVAYLIDPIAGGDWVDPILHHCREKWGGRYSALFCGGTNHIDEDEWTRLRKYDPDYIASTHSLSQELRARVETSVSPLKIDVLSGPQRRLLLSRDPVSLYPDLDLIKEVGKSVLDDGAPLVVFNLSANVSPIIRTFLDRNFGILVPREQVYHIKRALSEVPLDEHAIEDAASLNEALLRLGDYRRVVYPVQLSSVPNFLPDVQYNRDGQRFTVVVGDSIRDICYSWNRTHSMPSWVRTRITQLWLPLEIANDEAIRPGLSKLLDRFSEGVGSNQRHETHFASFSLNQSELEALRKSFRSTSLYYSSCQTLSRMPLAETYDGPAISPRAELHRAHGLEEHLTLPPISVREGSMGGQVWMVDMALQYRPERFKSIRGKDFWWSLPQNNHVLAQTRMFSREARVDSRGDFSVLMDRNSLGHQRLGSLIVRIPEDFTVASALFCRPAHGQMEPSDDFSSRPFHRVRFSDKGRYLAGVLSLFPDLYNAAAVLEERYWRRIFARMANQSETKDAQKKNEIVNRMVRQLGEWDDLPRSKERLEWWAERVLSLAKAYAKEDTELDFEALITEARGETNAYNDLHPDSEALDVDPNDVKQAIARLLSWNVLLQGCRPACPLCGYRIWYNIGELMQVMTCAGCQNVYTIGAEERWFYRLNSLVRAAVTSHGTVPLLLVLAQLMQEARTSFIFFPCLELLRSNESPSSSYRSVAEVDLACIQDGAFTIGEVKSSTGLFTKRDFDNLAMVAKAVRPDVLLFSSLQGGQSSFVNRHIGRLRDELGTTGTEVRWYPLHEHVLEPSPVI